MLDDKIQNYRSFKSTQMNESLHSFILCLDFWYILSLMYNNYLEKNGFFWSGLFKLNTIRHEPHCTAFCHRIHSMSHSCTAHRSERVEHNYNRLDRLLSHMGWTFQGQVTLCQGFWICYNHITSTKDSKEEVWAKHQKMRQFCPAK